MRANELVDAFYENQKKLKEYKHRAAIIFNLFLEKCNSLLGDISKCKFSFVDPQGKLEGI